MQRPRRRIISRLLLPLLVASAIFASLWLGLVPQRLSPFAPLQLSQADSWFLNFRLAALKSDSQLCSAILAQPELSATPIADQPIQNGCGWKNAVRTSKVGGVSLYTDKVSCEMAAALAMWIEHEVQPAAGTYLSQRVSGIRHLGTYACRNIAGSKLWKNFRSQHATAAAIDIEAFELSDGRVISVLKAWNGDTPEARFLRQIHKRACRYFRVAIGPEFNAAHANHFHYDRSALKSCR